MRTTLKFHFGDLPQKVQDGIKAENKLPCFVYVVYDGHHLCFANCKPGEGERCYLGQDTLLTIEPSDTTTKLPDWLKSVRCAIACYETFYGYVENGLFRYGNLRAEVNTFPKNISKTKFDQQSDMEYELYRYEVLATKLTISGQDLGATVYNGAIKLYRMIRAGKVTEQCTIERWPVQVPLGLVTIGASTGEVITTS